MNFGDLKKSLKMVSISDNDSLKRTPLGKLLQKYEAYPTSIQGSKHMILVEHGSTPRQLSDLPEISVAKKTIVIKENNGTWQKIWPEVNVDTSEEEFEMVEE